MSCCVSNLNSVSGRVLRMASRIETLALQLLSEDWTYHVDNDTMVFRTS